MAIFLKDGVNVVVRLSSMIKNSYQYKAEDGLSANIHNTCHC